MAHLDDATIIATTHNTARYFTEDITSAFVLEDGHIAVPGGPGTGVEILRDVLGRLTIHREVLR